MKMVVRAANSHPAQPCQKTQERLIIRPVVPPSHGADSEEQRASHMTLRFVWNAGRAQRNDQEEPQNPKTQLTTRCIAKHMGPASWFDRNQLIGQGFDFDIQALEMLVEESIGQTDNRGQREGRAAMACTGEAL